MIVKKARRRTKLAAWPKSFAVPLWTTFCFRSSVGGTAGDSHRAFLIGGYQPQRMLTVTLVLAVGQHPAWRVMRRAWSGAHRVGQ